MARTVDGLRLCAYALLVVAIRRYAEMRQHVEEAALRNERERIARELHDGLAQDLALIAAHVPQLRSQAGAQHPLTIAAERALAASRGSILDLSASSAPTTSAALRQVADELSARFGVQIDVRVENERAQRVTDNLTAADREHLVRIGREAIVNAITHGGARTIDVLLECRGPHLLLRIRDDGCGLDDAPLQTRHGFGLAAMGARAESLGGLLSARSETAGGTVVEVTVPDFGAG